VDWGSITRWAVLLAGAFGAGLLAIWVFTGVWARSGLLAAVAVLVIALYLVNRWSKRQAARHREQWERTR
jgi:membrane protein YdbS with pleckstrin-like domain